MEKLRFDFFDILGYLIPGTALLMSLWVTADTSVHQLSDLYNFVKKVDANVLLSGIVIAYVTGFTLHLLGSLLFSWMNGPMHRRRDAVTKNVGVYWALIRENGERHMVILDRWWALKALSSNLAAFAAVASLLALVKWRLTHYWEWACLTPVFLALFFIYNNRAKRFHRFLDDDSYAVFQALDLKKQLPSDV